MEIQPFVIDDIETSRPHIRLCHRILADSIGARYTAIEFVRPSGEIPTVRTLTSGGWREFMALPPAVFETLIGYLKDKAPVPGADPAHRYLLVRLGNQEACFRLSTRRNEDDLEELTLVSSVPPGPGSVV